MMMRRHQAELDALLVQAERDTDVMAIVRYGSVARNEAHLHSDLDICLVLDPRRGPFSAQDMAQARTRYLASDLDIKIFQSLPLYVRQRVLQEGQVVFVRDVSTLYDVALQTVQQYEDFRPIYEQYLDQVANAGS